MATSRLCAIPGCGNLTKNRKLCGSHYHRLLRYGDPLEGGPPVGLPAKHLVEVILPYAENDCIQWPFSKMASGYGQVSFNKKKYLVHRLVCELTNGPSPERGMDAAHNCGNANCVNPKHIRWATRADNLADRYTHGTATIGERHGHSKLSETDVLAIRHLIEKGLPMAAIASRYQVTPASIRDIKTGKNWGWLQEPA